VIIRSGGIGCGARWNCSANIWGCFGRPSRSLHLLQSPSTPLPDGDQTVTPKGTRVTICPKMTPPLTTTQRAQQQRQRAMAARAVVRRSKAWASEAASIAAQTLWRVASTWVEQSDGTHCAEFTHVCTGQSRVVTLSSLLHPTSDARQTEVLRRLSGVEPKAAASIQS
jgi:hypothetical protein